MGEAACGDDILQRVACRRHRRAILIDGRAIRLGDHGDDWVGLVRIDDHDAILPAARGIAFLDSHTHPSLSWRASRDVYGATEFTFDVSETDG